MAETVTGDETADRPWTLQTTSGGSSYQAYRGEALDPPVLVVQVGRSEPRYHLRCLESLRAMLIDRDEWVALGNADEQKTAADGTVEAWARSSDNPVGGWYGLK